MEIKNEAILFATGRVPKSEIMNASVRSGPACGTILSNRKNVMSQWCVALFFAT